ncbi:MAG TPA: hypothetical protein VKU37_06600 [Verrucomicrobiae bacterium]|nr:hypothetical protein [Verrucomicrobiae bacterium]
MTVRTRNRLITFSILAGPFVFFLGLLLFWDAEPLPPVPPLPNPNGYDSLVKAGNMVSNDFDDYDELSPAKLSELTNKDAEAFQTTRTGLQQECRVPLDYSATSLAHLDQLTALKRLAIAVTAEGRLAEKENRTSDAAKFYLDVIDLGNESSRGGIILDQLVGTAIEVNGVSHLQKLVDQLDAKSCREAARTLETLDSQRQTWDEVMQQERDWSRRTFTGIRYGLVRVMSRNSLNKVYQSAEQKFDAQQIKTRQLIIDLAARAYQLDKGHPPANLADLVPDYLKAIPQDPLTGTNMVYSP